MLKCIDLFLKKLEFKLLGEDWPVFAASVSVDIKTKSDCRWPLCVAQSREIALL